MKVLALVACVLAVANAGYAPLGYSIYPQHIPVIGPNGVPIETPEVQHAKAAHYAAHAEASARAGHLGHHYAPLAHHVYGVPAVGVVHNALPADTPEVAAAKAQHFADYAVAAHRNGVNVVAPVVHHIGAHHPVDTPEVQLAKAAHFAAHAAASHGLVHYRKRRGIYAYAHHVPVIGPNGVPVDTPEVQAAKAEHFAAHAKALGGGHYAPHYAPIYYGSVYPHAAIGPNGHPVETHEVQLAKAAHFAAHAAARGHHYY